MPAASSDANFYIGMRHWLDGDVEGGKALLMRAAHECKRTLTEAEMAKAWLAAGPGPTQAASATPEPNTAAR